VVRKNSQQKSEVKPVVPPTPAGRKAAFLIEYESRGSLTAAATAAGIVRRTHYDWLEKDPEYVKSFEAAKLRAIDSLESVAFDRAFSGSDLLLIFLLKANNPAKYRDKYEQPNVPPERQRDDDTHGLTVEPPSRDVDGAAKDRRPN